jgi:pyruvate,water dikinase
MLLDHIAYHFIAGFPYKLEVPASDEEVPARIQAAAQALERRIWREDLELWEREVKPDSIERNLAIQAIGPSGLSDSELMAHIDRCRDHGAEMLYRHHRFNGATLVPVGDFLVHASEWTGKPAGDLLALLCGSAPVSAGLADGLERLAAAIRADEAARSLLAGRDDPASILERLRSMPGETGSAATAYLERVSFRLLDGFDISEPTAIEKPDVLVAAIRRFAEEGGGAETTEADVQRIRDSVAPDHQAQFDELLAEARLVYRLRDERGIFNDIWGTGLTRRAVLEAGRRLAERGDLHEAEHLVDASLPEMRSLLLEGTGPSAAELAARAEFRCSLTPHDVPRSLGDPPPPPPPFESLPPAAARINRATFTAIQGLFGDSEAEHEAQLLRGLAASPGVYEGTARLIIGPSELDRLQAGDVLLTTSTGEAFNIALPLVGAIVTDRGGLLSHAAIVAREYGVPGVVGTRSATKDIRDGARVRVDGGSGEVVILA